ncbi:MAG: hypothetical protein ABIF12_03855, partial [bacterium]
TLTSLDLDYNRIGDAGALALADALKVNRTLTSLNLGRNGIHAEGAQALANALRVNTTLTSLDLSYNRIGDAGVLAVEQINFYLNRNRSITPLQLDFLKALKEGFCFLDRVDGNRMKLQAKKERAERLFNSYIILPLAVEYELNGKMIREERGTGEEDTIFFDKNFLLNRLSLSEENFEVFIEYLNSRSREESISFFYWLYADIYFYLDSEQIANDILGDFIQRYNLTIKVIPLNQILKEMMGNLNKED